jgi:hypothetical protein
MSSWDQANRWGKLGLVWRNRKKISQIINDYLYLPFFLLIIIYSGLSQSSFLQCCSFKKITSSWFQRREWTPPGPVGSGGVGTCLVQWSQAGEGVQSSLACTVASWPKFRPNNSKRVIKKCKLKMKLQES